MNKPKKEKIPGGTDFWNAMTELAPAFNKADKAAHDWVKTWKEYDSDEHRRFLLGNLVADASQLCPMTLMVIQSITMLLARQQQAENETPHLH